MTWSRPALTLAGCLLLMTGTAAAAGPRPDLAVTRVATPPGAAPGGTLKVADTVRVRGRAPATRVAYVLSKDRLRGPGDIPLGRRTVLRRGSSAATVLRVPARVTAGTYRVIACADAGRLVREGSERDNCRVSAPVTIVARFAPRPLNRPATLDPSRATSAEVGPAGATLTTTAADGTRAVLTVPAGAVREPTRLTVTPVTAIPRLPFDGLGAAVDLQPAGMRFARPLTLALTAAKAPDPRRVLGFATASGGADLHLDAARATGATVTVGLDHFSVHGYALGTAAQARAVESRTPSTREAWTKNAAAAPGLSPELRRARQRAYLYVWATDGVIPLLERATRDETVTLLALREVGAWRRAGALLGTRDPGLDALDVRMGVLAAKAVTFATNARYRRCVEGADPSQGREMIELERALELTGRPGEGTDTAVLVDRLRRCLNFELEFGSRLSFKDTDPDDGTSGEGRFDVRSVVALPYEDILVGIGDARAPEGSGPLTYPGFAFATVTGRACGAETRSVRTEGVSAPAGAPVLRVERLNLRIERAGSADPGIDVVLDLGTPQERYRLIGGCGPAEIADDGWAKLFHLMHPEPLLPLQPTAYAFTGFARGQGFLFARKEIVADRTVGDDAVHSELTIDLRHRPLKADAALPLVGGEK